jgi:hypothetical protein
MRERTGKISPADFYVIIKANRAKTRIRDRLDKRKGGFALAVSDIAASLSASPGPRERLEVLRIGVFGCQWQRQS